MIENLKSGRLEKRLNLAKKISKPSHVLAELSKW